MFIIKILFAKIAFGEMELSSFTVFALFSLAAVTFISVIISSLKLVSTAINSKNN